MTATRSLTNMPPTLHMPLVTLGTAAGLCEGAKPDDLLCDIGDAIGSADPRRLPWVFNIAGAGAEKRELRLLAKAVRPEHRAEWARRTLDQVLLEIFPEARAQHLRLLTIPAARIALRLDCSPDHTINLIEDGLLYALPHTRHKTGAGNSPAVTWASLREFLAARKL